MDRMYSLSVYETSTHFYIIGQDSTGSRFRTLKIDRIAEKEFVASEPDHDYNKADIGELLATVSSSSIVTPTEKWNRRGNSASGNGLLRTVDKAYGLIGAIRFLEGYYLLLVSRAKQVVQIGYHIIYKVEDVSMIYLPASGTASHPDELKYSKLFQTVDFTTNFYFSYTYKLSRTLQENCLSERNIKWNRNFYKPAMESEREFIWNDFLLEPLRKNEVSRKWSLELIHGYVAHQLVELPCLKLDLIILARRSAEFAGTRFLKRGQNYSGAVANDVETEQIIWDNRGPQSFRFGKFSAFVQRRGSVPLFWSQDSTHRGAPMVVGKPPITIDRVEPHALTTAIHFRKFRRKYGHPCVVLNLVKRNDRKHNEHLLHEIFLRTIRYLNQFRCTGHCIDYISFDVSRCNKNAGQVLQCLDQLGQRIVLSNGWFQTFAPLKSHSLSELLSYKYKYIRQQFSFGIEEMIDRFTPELSSDGEMLLQHGIVRANCVDCLDRTNVAQFGLGKSVLGWQLYSMGLLEHPWQLNLHTELCRVFEELFDEHGDTLALQYAGSQLVHSIKTYKRTAVLQERSRDVLQTISRYYSNTFSDFEKQNGINLFLGMYRVCQEQPSIWSIGTDHYLHFPITLPKRNEFLRWSVSVSSDNEDDDWLEDREFYDWILIKAREGNDIRIDNNWIEIEEDIDRKKKFDDNQSEEDVTNMEELESRLFELAYRTTELTSLEKLLRANQQMQIRRPIALDALQQMTFGENQPSNNSTFMRMFKGEHSPSPTPPNLNKRGSVADGSTSSSSSNQIVVGLSSLAAGTASIVRESSNANDNNDVKKQPLLLAEEDEEHEYYQITATECADAKAEEEKIRDAKSPPPPHTSTSSSSLFNGLDNKISKQLDASSEAALAVPVAEEQEERDEQAEDLLILEDRNAPAQRMKNPIIRFKDLLNFQPARMREQSHSHRLGIGTGLKSPQEVYFGNDGSPFSLQQLSRPTSTCSSPTAKTLPASAFTSFLPISEQDMALYIRYASVAECVFERHNLRRQRRKLPNPLKSIRRPSTATVQSPIVSPNHLSSIFSPNSHRSTPSRQQQPKSGGISNVISRSARPFTTLAKSASTSTALSSTSKNVVNNKDVGEQQQPTPQNPFRKNFCRLGPVFEFKPAFFTVDNAFHTELGDVPEESVRLYQQTVKATAAMR